MKKAQKAQTTKTKKTPEAVPTTLFMTASLVCCTSVVARWVAWTCPSCASARTGSVAAEAAVALLEPTLRACTPAEAELEAGEDGLGAESETMMGYAMSPLLLMSYPAAMHRGRAAVGKATA